MNDTPPAPSKAPPPASLQRAAGPLSALRADLLGAVEDVARAAGADGAGELSPARGHGAITLERPRRAQFGDYSTNAAMLLAGRLGEQPRAVAERLGLALAGRLGASLQRHEIAGPGFLNLFLSDAWVAAALAEVLGAGEGFGGGGASAPERVLVEFVSSNPTGPLHVGHARNAAYGDALARILAFHGHTVAREFYVNDAGSQIAKLGESIRLLGLGQEVPEDGYHGDYLRELLPLLGDSLDESAEALGRAAVELMLERIAPSLRAFGVLDFETWFHESSLHSGEPSEVDSTLALLAERGCTYTSDGALWLRTTDFGDDKDRVLVRSSGEHTYFASDIAYHQDKRERGFERQIDVWGADHHGYIQRMKAAYQALGGDPGELELLIMQLVHLVRSGERAQMSKRAGEFVTLDDLLEEIGVDAARWYLLARSHDTTMELDVDLARQRSNENPVYYVQYAHARIASMLERAGEERVRAATSSQGAEMELHRTERELIQQLLGFPEELAEAAERRAPHRVVAYVLELAQSFTAFYRDCRVVGAESTTAESFRICLCVATRACIARCLGLLGVSAPQEM
jgi:arginyl-tRNA synthetase